MTLPDGRRLERDVSVAAYDVGDDVALLKLPATFASPLQVGEDIEEGQFVWALGYPGCGAAAVEGLRVAAQQDGLLQLSDTLPGEGHGGPVIDQTGRVVGLGVGPLSALLAARASDQVATAQANVQSGALLTAIEVARSERHLYGSIEVTSDVTGVVARITPIDAWLWVETARMGTLPLTFTAPMGRYQVEILVQGEVQRRVDFAVQPDLVGRLEVPAAPEEVAAADGGGGFPWAIALVGVAGAGAAVALFAGGGEGNGGGPPPPPPSEPGSISVSIPNR